MKYIAFVLSLLGLIAFIWYFIFLENVELKINPVFVERLHQNYGSQIDSICKVLKLPPAYFKALVILECSAEKPAATRFEPKVYEKLLALQKGEIEKYSNLTHQQLQDYSADELQDLATSWGPLQIMGYHCIHLKIPLKALKGGQSLQYGIIYCEKEYGRYLREKKFRDCFHIHNTGKKYPKFWSATTYNPDYVALGIAYMQLFD